MIIVVTIQLCGWTHTCSSDESGGNLRNLLLDHIALGDEHASFEIRCVSMQALARTLPWIRGDGPLAAPMYNGTFYPQDPAFDLQAKLKDPLAL